MTDFSMDGNKTPRRKSRILPSMLFKRSLGTAATTTNSNGQGSELSWMRKDATDGNAAAGTSTFPGFDKTWSDAKRGGRELNGSEPSYGSEAVLGTIGGSQGADSGGGVGPTTPSLSSAIDQPLDQLCEAMNQLVDKMTAVAAINMDLANFNESFGALLYGLKMNASTIEWTEAPTKESFERQEQREREAELLQEQQKELERIRQQQQLELERREANRREQERILAEEHQRQLAMSRTDGFSSGASATASRSRIPRTGTGVGGAAPRPGGRGLSRPIRPTTPAPIKQSGAMRAQSSRAPSSASSSRVGPSGQVRKIKGRVVMKRMLDRLPLKYREEPHRSVLEAIMASLEAHEQGQTLPELTAVSGVARQRCNEYLGVLIQAKEVARSNQRGVIFVLNPDRYPTPTRRD